MRPDEQPASCWEHGAMGNRPALSQSGCDVAVILVTGIQASGKSTVAQALAERLDRSVHVRGDLFRRMVVNGRVEMGSANPRPEAVRQLRLRYQLAAAAADGYADAGFTVVLQDIIIGSHLTGGVGHPDPPAVRRRACSARRCGSAPRGRPADSAGQDRLQARRPVGYRAGRPLPRANSQDRHVDRHRR